MIRRALVTCVALMGIIGPWQAAVASRAQDFLREGYRAAMAREWDEAIQWYTRAVQEDGANPEIYFHRAVALEMAQRLDEAASDYEKALQLKPDNYLALEYLGKLYERKGDYIRALEMYRRALPLVKNSKWRSILKVWMTQAEEKIRESKRR